MKFFSQVALSLIVIVATYSGANLLRIGERLNTRPNYTCQMMEHKQRLALDMPRPALFVIGASNVMFNIRADILAAKAGRPVMNLGLPASLGIEMILANARAVLKRGDIALLNIEHFFFIEYQSDGPFFKQALFQCPTDTYRDFAFAERMKMFIAQPPLEVITGLIQRAARAMRLPLPFAVAEYRFERPIDKNGNHPGYTKSRRTPAMEALVERAPGGITLDFSLNSTGARALPGFVQWARQRGIHVVASWPAVYWPRRDLAAPGLAELRKFYASLDLTVLGEPTDTMRPLDEFFDSNNHLTAEAAGPRSEALAALLAGYLNSTSLTQQ